MENDFEVRTVNFTRILHLYFLIKYLSRKPNLTFKIYNGLRTRGYAKILFWKSSTQLNIKSSLGTFLNRQKCV